MTETNVPPRAAQAVHQLVEQLVRVRVRNRDADEWEARREVWAELNEHAGLSDPNHLTNDAVESAAWVLIALLAIELRDRWED